MLRCIQLDKDYQFYAISFAMKSIAKRAVQKLKSGNFAQLSENKYSEKEYFKRISRLIALKMDFQALCQLLSEIMKQIIAFDYIFKHLMLTFVQKCFRSTT